MPPSKKLLAEKLKKSAVYSEKDFKNAGERIERLCMHVLEPGNGLRIGDRDLVYVERLGEAYNLLMSSPNKMEAGRKLMSKHPDEIQRIGKALDIINDAELVYGKVLFNDIDFEKQKIVSKAWALYEKCLENEEFYTANSVLKTIADVQGVGKEQNIEDFFKDLTLPQPRFSDDPAILQLGEAEEAQVDEEE